MRRNLKSININKFTIIITSMIMLSLLLIFSSSFYYYKFIYTTKDNVFWGMIDGMLSSKAISRTVIHNNPNQKSTQKSLIDNTNELLSYTTVDIESDRSSNGLKKLSSEQFGTKQNDYIKYVSYEMAEGAVLPVNFENVAGKWADSVNPQNGGQATNLIISLTNSFVPSGRLSYQQRENLVTVLKDSNYFDMDIDSAEKLTFNGRPAYKYKAKITYAAFSKSYNRYLQLLGLQGETPFYDESDQYNQNSEIIIEMIVDIRSRRLLQVTSPSEDGQTPALVENYSSFFANLNLEKPKNVLTSEELQKLMEKNSEDSTSEEQTSGNQTDTSQEPVDNSTSDQQTTQPSEVPVE